jgi:hypothetical protein
LVSNNGSSLPSPCMRSVAETATRKSSRSTYNVSPSRLSSASVGSPIRKGIGWPTVVARGEGADDWAAPTGALPSRAPAIRSARLKRTGIEWIRMVAHELKEECNWMGNSPHLHPLPNAEPAPAPVQRCASCAGSGVWT